MVEGLSRSRQWGYVLGTAGWTLVDRIIVGFLIFFYLPPENVGLPTRIDERVFWGVTAFGLIMLLGRIVDSIADPMVAAWSDQTRKPMGRRRVFLAWGALPVAGMTAVLFFPPTSDASFQNMLFLAATLALFFFAFTIYVAPYLALIPELARTQTDRIHLTTQQAFATLLGAMVAMIAIPVMVTAFGGGATGYQYSILIACMAAAVFMLLPVFAVDEKRFTTQSPGNPTGLLESLRLTLSNRPFLLYLGGNIGFWFAFNLISSEALYFTTVLMGVEEAFQGIALSATFGVAALFFVIWNVTARRIGKRRAMLWAGVSFVIACLSFVFVRDKTTGVLAFSLVGIPVGALLVIPNAMLSDCSDFDAERTGSRREAMFFGVQGFFLKVNLGLSTAILAALLAAFGKDVGNDLGIRLGGPVAAIFVLLGMWCFWRYPEEKVLSEE